jgi:type II secretory pathway predicted ATPase ExeA
LFSDDALALIRQTSQGIPRAISNLAGQALIVAYAGGNILDEVTTR